MTNFINFIFGQWGPMAVSAAIIVPILLVLSGMALSVSRKCIRQNAKIIEGEKRSRGNKKRDRRRAEQEEERLEEIRGYRRACALLGIAALGVVATYGTMALLTLHPPFDLVGAGATVVAFGAAALLIFMWHKSPFPGSEGRGGGAEEEL